MSLAFTGEFYVPEKTSDRIQEDTVARYRFAQQYVRGKDVLEIACGSGFGSAMLAEAGARSVTGADVSEAALQYAREHFGNEKIHFERCNLEELSMLGCFDVAVCFETIEHVRQYERSLRNLYDALRPGGVLILTTPNRRITSPTSRSIHDAPPNPYHTQEFVPEEMRELLIGAGFDASSLILLGQRQQPRMPNRYLRFLLKKLYDPGHRSSPQFTPIKPLLHARDFLYLAKKAG